MKCELCGKEHARSYGSGRFCSKECARSSSTIKDNKKETKDGHCSTCGKFMRINKRASSKQVKCDDCRTNIIVNKKYVPKKNICKVCGNDKRKQKCKRPDVCRKSQAFPGLNKYFGFNLSLMGSEKIYEEFDRVKQMLIEDHIDNETSTEDMAIKYNHNNGGNFRKILYSLKIEIRNLSQSTSLSHKQGKVSINSGKQYKHGYHTTWNNKQVFYRSSYELDHAKELDELRIDYEMETLRIQYWDSQKLMTRTAIPDFYLPEENKIVEIKSNWTYDEQRMKDKFKTYKEHGYKTELILEHKSVNI